MGNILNKIIHRFIYTEGTKHEMWSLISGSKSEMQGLVVGGDPKVIRSQFVNDFNRLKKEKWPEYYADLYRQYASFMRAPGIYKIASGASDLNYNWTEVLMREAAPMMNGLSLHYYTLPGDRNKKGSATQFNDSIWLVTLQKTLKMEEILENNI